MYQKPMLETDVDLFAAMVLEAVVSVWRKRSGRISELCEYGVKIDKYTPHYVRVRYEDGCCAYFARKDYDFIIYRTPKPDRK